MSGGRGWEGAAVGEREPVVLASDRRRRGLAVVGVGGDAGVGAHEVLRAVSAYRLRLPSAVCSEKTPQEASRQRRRSRQGRADKIWGPVPNSKTRPTALEK